MIDEPQDYNKLNNKTYASSHLLDFLQTKSFGNGRMENPKVLSSAEPQEISHDNPSKNEEVIHSLNESQILVEKTKTVLKSIGNQLKLTDEQLHSLIKEYDHFITNYFKDKEFQELEYKNMLYENVKKFLGNEFKSKEVLIKKATSWLGIDSLSTQEEYLSFLDKMSILGKMISEDEDIRNEQPSYVLTKQEAIKERNALMADDKFKYALTNKLHPLHNDALDKLRKLNSIIVS